MTAIKNYFIIFVALSIMGIVYYQTSPSDVGLMHYTWAAIIGGGLIGGTIIKLICENDFLLKVAYFAKPVLCVAFVVYAYNFF
ncbi:TPA: hypothetical protein NHK58_001436 [Pseudomonas aeruginosa]|nr:hypothetical protein [Pseudomonas aeruginosa]